MSSEQRFYVREDGSLIGSFDGDGPGYGSVVPTWPEDTRMRWDGEIWKLPEKPIEDIKSDIALRRYAAETNGIIFSGMPLATDRDSQGLINGAALSAYTDPSYVCRWKTSAGYVTLDAATLKAVAKAIRDHVQACFDREDELTKAVDDGTYTDAMLEEGWPG